jgi:hypothetical protein
MPGDEQFYLGGELHGLIGSRHAHRSNLPPGVPALGERLGAGISRPYSIFLM